MNSGHHCHSGEQLTTTTPRPHRTSGSTLNHHTRRKNNNLPPKTAKPNHRIRTEEGPDPQQQRLAGTERNNRRGS
ncbi:hypothetical protein P8452_73901 [Trifolium repens]|nr:hypothetical protein P8452_73901 [Trifolium repens]